MKMFKVSDYIWIVQPLTLKPILIGFRAPHSDRSDETIKGKQSEFYMAVSKFSDQISALEQLAILKVDIFGYLYI
jgi:hypothetical protein